MKTTSAPRIAFDDVGDGGPALLLLPGWCGPRTAYRKLLPRVAKTRRVLAVDFRGHGGSDPSPGDFGYAEVLEDALRVLDVAGVDQVIPVSAAHGGWTAIDLRRRLGPKRVPGVALVDWMVLGAPPPFFEALKALQHPQAWSDLRNQLFEMWMSGIDLPALREYLGEMKAFDGEMWRRAGREISARFTADPMPLKLLERETTPCPTLHVYAQPADPAFLAAQQAYAREHSWFRVHRLEAKTHFPMIEVPEQLAAQLEAFAASL